MARALKRTLDPARFNEIANDPEVRPWLGGSGELDLMGHISNPENFAFLTDDETGGFFYHKRAIGLYEVHTVSLPKGRGQTLLETRSASLRAMFMQSDAIEIVTTVPDGNRAADAYSIDAGFHETFRREACFDLKGEMVGASYRSLGYGEWVLKDQLNTFNGKIFHDFVHQSTPDDHGPDSVHDAWVGATMEGCRHGNAAKCIGLYNRWAVQAGYEPLNVLSANPLTVDMRSAVLQLDADGLHVLSAQGV